jgi:enoyl-CoA hydratase
MAEDHVLFDVSERIATITLNRPDARNALSSDVLRLLPDRLRQAEASDDVDVIVLTGADPAFCAGLDLKELGSTGGNLGGTGSRDRGPFPHVTKPIVGAINGVAITGGLELALNCDFLVASQHAKFGDTHVLCNASVDERVPPWMRNSGKGWQGRINNVLSDHVDSLNSNL